MSRFIEAAENLLPKENLGMESFYNQVLTKYGFDSGTVINDGRLIAEEEEKRVLAYNLFRAGIAYLAQRSSTEALNDVGYTAWRATEDSLIYVGATPDSCLQDKAAELGFDIEIARGIRRDNPRLKLALKIEESRKIYNRQEIGVAYSRIAVLIPSSFGDYCITNPVTSLADIAGIGSCMRDLILLPRPIVNPKHYPDQPEYIKMTSLRKRALACIASVLLEAKLEEVGFYMSPDYQKILQEYPRGISSLPTGIWYKTPEKHFPYDAPAFQGFSGQIVMN